MGMRAVPAPVRCADEWESDEWTFPVQREQWDEFAGGDGDAEDVGAWAEIAECVDEDDASPYDALLAPEHVDTLDFTGFMPTIVSTPLAARPRRIEPPRRAVHAPRSRVAQASVRLAEIGKMRPVVHIPARAAASAKERVTSARRETRLPPVWLLANLFILLVAGLAVLPRVVQVDAAAGCQWYTVRPGDTLGNLGWAHHTNALALAKANQIANPNLIYVGQRLCIPLTQDAHTTSAPKVPATTQPPRYGSAQGVQSFVQFALPYVRQAHNATGWPTSMILAQWGLEQGWKVPGYTGFNWGNVAALPGEPTVNGIAVPGSPAAFAYANTPDIGLSYYIRVARLSFYNGVGRAAQNGPDAAARALGRSPWDAGHYTAIGSPGSSLLNLMRVYNLYYYDSH